jgi:hypothetical protein
MFGSILISRRIAMDQNWHMGYWIHLDSLASTRKFG